MDELRIELTETARALELVGQPELNGDRSEDGPSRPRRETVLLALTESRLEEALRVAEDAERLARAARTAMLAERRRAFEAGAERDFLRGELEEARAAEDAARARQAADDELRSNLEELRRNLKDHKDQLVAVNGELEAARWGQTTAEQEAKFRAQEASRVAEEAGQRRADVLHAKIGNLRDQNRRLTKEIKQLRKSRALRVARALGYLRDPLNPKTRRMVARKLPGLFGAVEPGKKTARRRPSR